KMRQYKRKHIVYECIVQIGDKDDTGNNAELEKEALIQFAKDWERRNPNLKLIGAYIHADEPDGTVHMHIDYIPVAECTRGMKLQNSLDKALQQQGFKSENVRKTAQIAWQDSERKALINICNELGINVYQNTQGVTNGREHLSKAEYQQLKETAKKQMEWELLPYKSLVEDFLQTEPQNVIEGTPVPVAAKMLVGKENRDKLLYSPAEIEEVQKLAKAAAVMSAKNQQDNAELYNKFAKMRELENKLATNVTKAMKRERQAEQQLQQATAEAAAIKNEADVYATQMREFYAEHFPYVQRLISEKNQLKEDFKNTMNEKIGELQEKLKNKSETVEWLNSDRNDLKSCVKEQEQEIGKLKSQLRELQTVKKQNGELSERIKALEYDLEVKKRSINQKDEEIQSLANQNKTNDELYKKTYEVGEYIADKVGLDFEEILDKHLDGYGLAYIIDEGHNKGAR
ncbi:MAG: hypothetical protein NC120_14085, partial [Ruminococcus sp.]|nr:hypothetical protein [Ruminococcus sp.]